MLDSETFHDNLFFTIATAAIAEIQNIPFFKYRKISLEECTFCNDNIYKAYEQLISIYHNISGTSKKMIITKWSPDI